MIALSLSTDDARFLEEQLARLAEHMEGELVHTDARDMQRDLARELERLQGITARLTAALGAEARRSRNGSPR